MTRPDYLAIGIDACLAPFRTGQDKEQSPRVERLTPDPERSGYQFYSADAKPWHVAHWTQLAGRPCYGYWLSRDYTKQPVCVVLDFGDGQIGCLTHASATTCPAARAVAATYTYPRGDAQGA